MAITFIRLKEYLNLIAQQGTLDPANSGHGVFWNTDYPTFRDGVVPSKVCNGAPVPILNKADLTQSAFYQILQAGWCFAPAAPQIPRMPQMPKTGPFVNSPGYSIKLADGTVVPGTQVLQDIGDWLKAGAPENG